MFLRSLESHISITTQWFDTVLSRIHFRDIIAAKNNSQLYSSEYDKLIRYWKFVRLIRRAITTWDNAVMYHFIFCLIAPFLSIGLLARSKHPKILYTIPLTYLAFCWLVLLQHVLAPNPVYPMVNKRSNEKPDMKPDMQSTFLNALFTRKATNPKDMSFGLQSILRHSAKAANLR
jgi:hypothetical protein